MTPEELTSLLSGLEAAADVVEAIGDEEKQRERGWDLSRWGYELVPWGVRFIHHGQPERDGGRAEILVLAAVKAANPYPIDRIREPRVWVVFSGA